MSRFSLLGRGGAFYGNLLEGDPTGAYYSLMSPQSVSPEESRTIRERMELDEGLMGVMFDTVTNPFLLLGLALHFRFPVTKLEEIIEAPKHLSKTYSKSFLPPVLQKLKSAFGIFADREDVLEPLSSMGMWRVRKVNDFVETFREGAEEFANNMGRHLKERDLRMMALWLDGLTDEAQFARKIGLERAWKKFRNPVDMDKFRAAWTEGHEALGQKLRGKLTEIYEDLLLRSPEMEEEVRKALVRKYGNISRKTIEEMMSRKNLDIPLSVREALIDSPTYVKLRDEVNLTGTITPGSWRKDFWPHVLPTDMRKDEEVLQDLIASVSGDLERFTLKQGRVVEKQAPGSLLSREGKMVADPRDFNHKSIKDLMNPSALRQYEESVVEAMSRGEVAPYSLAFDRTMETYVNGMANAFATNYKRNGSRLVAAAKALGAEKDPRAAILSSDLLPLALGRRDAARAARSQWWMGVRTRMTDWLEEEKTKKYLGKGITEWMSKQLNKEAGPFTIMSAEDGFVDLMYHGALGGNAGTAALNAMQSLMTTFPLLGMDGVRGVGRALKGMTKYFEKRLGGMSHESALQRTFPKFVEAGFGDVYKFRDVYDGLEDAFNQAKATPLRKGWNKVRSALMFGFEKVELVNQLGAFEGAMLKGAREGMKGEKLLMAARKVTELTQFTPGLVNTPVFLHKMKGIPGGRMLSMFLQFGLRYPEFLSHTAKIAGAGAAQRAGKAWGGYNFGTLGRMLAISGATYEVGKALNIDLGRGLVFGALPDVREGRAFYPSPFVPPILSLVGSAVMDFSKGEFQNLPYTLPLLAPGGVAATRAVGFFPGTEKVARAMGRKYVDYNSPVAGGRLPLMTETENGSRLIGYFTPWQILMKGLGLPWYGDVQKESESLRWLLGNRKRILSYKKMYLEGWLHNDYARMERVDEKFKSVYPQLKGGLRRIVRPQDWQAVTMRKQVTRLERVMQSLPREMRPMFAQAVSTSILNSGENVMGADPGLLGVGGQQKVRKWKQQTNGETFYDRASPIGGGYNLGREQVPRNVSLPNVRGY